MKHLWMAATIMCAVVAPALVPAQLSSSAVAAVHALLPAPVAGVAESLDELIAPSWGWFLLHTAVFMAVGCMITYKTLADKTQSPFLLLVAWCFGASALYASRGQ